MKDSLTWHKYEDALYNYLYYKYGPPDYMVRRNDNEFIGRYSKIKRQIDIAVYKATNREKPYIAAECKFYKRILHVKDVEAYIGMLDDIGAEVGILASLQGFSKGAQQRARSTNLELVALGLKDSIRLNWREPARQVFPYDETFHEQMGDALYVLDTSDEVEDSLEQLEELPFEEWDTLLQLYLQEDKNRCLVVLQNIAEHHPDDGWRYNAVRILEDNYLLSDELRSKILETETDLTILELLREN